MAVKVQIELSDDEDKIVQVYRIEHNKKNIEDAVKDIIRQYKPLSQYKEKNKQSWFSKL